MFTGGLKCDCSAAVARSAAKFPDSIQVAKAAPKFLEQPKLEYSDVRNRLVLN